MTDLRARRGDDEIYEFSIKQADGSPLNLTGLSIWFTVKPSFEHTDAEALAQRSVGNGITVVDAAAGRCDVTLLAAATAGLSGARAARLVWDCQIKDATGLIQTVDGGQLIVDPDVTRSTA